MKKSISHLILIFFFVLLYTKTSHALCPDSFPPINAKDYHSPQLKKPVQNIILIIGDGFGPVQLEAAFPKQKTMPSPFKDFPHQGKINHCSLSGITDSAAAATTFATGVKTLNRRIGLSADEKPLKTILQFAQEKNKRVGLVTNTEITHATPAGFAAKQKSRYAAKAIAVDYMTLSRPDLLLGGGRKYFAQIGLPVKPGKKAPFTWYGYQVVRSSKALQLAVDDKESQKILGIFSNEHMAYEYEKTFFSLQKKEPPLRELSQKAIEFLSKSPDGFFLMIEGGRIDHASHKNSLKHLIPEVKEFSHTVKWVLDWAKKTPNTLLLVTADHETGGLNHRGKVFSWSTFGHTITPVYLWGYGPNSDSIREIQDNRAVFHIMNEALQKQ